MISNFYEFVLLTLIKSCQKIEIFVNPFKAFSQILVLATTGSKMSSTLQVMHQKEENVGIFGRLYIWHLPSSSEFVPPRNSKLVSDIASIDHLLVIAHEIFQYVPEFRFKKHASDILTKNVIGTLKKNFLLIIFFLNLS